eukprot:6192247-Pleurochrysis_carterae.AAC.2
MEQRAREVRLSSQRRTHRGYRTCLQAAHAPETEERRRAGQISPKTGPQWMTEESAGGKVIMACTGSCDGCHCPMFCAMLYTLSCICICICGSGCSCGRMCVCPYMCAPWLTHGKAAGITWPVA